MSEYSRRIEHQRPQRTRARLSCRKRHEALPDGASGEYFQDKTANRGTYFGNDDPRRSKMPAIVQIVFDPNGLVHATKRSA